MQSNAPQAQRPQARDHSGVVRYLVNTFDQVTQNVPRAKRDASGPNNLYRWQTEFAYLLHEVVMGPPAVMQKNIAACNAFIDRVMWMISHTGNEEMR